MVLGFIAAVVNAILSFIVNLVLLLVEIVLLPIRAVGYLINRMIGGTRVTTGYFSRPWGWRWRNRRYLGDQVV